MSGILTIIALAGLVWGVYYCLRGSMVAGLLAVLVGGYCFGHELISFDIGPLPLTIDRLLLGGVIVAYAVQRRLGLVQAKPLGWTEIGLLSFAFVLTASTFLHNWRLDTPHKVSPIWQLVAGYLIPVILYFIARDARLGDRTIALAHGVLALFGVYLAVTALAEVTRQWWLVYPSYIADPERGIHFGRARGPLLQSQSLGLYLSMCLLCAWAWWGRLRRPGQMALILAVPLFLAAIYYTYTRCVWLGAGLGAMIVIALATHRSWRPLLLGMALTGSLLFAVLFGDRILSIERDAGAVAARDSVSQRVSFAYVSWQMFLEHPILGVGFGQFTDAKRPYLSDRSSSLYLEAIRYQPHHNTFLSLLTETGLVGVGLYVLVLMAWARNAWTMWRDADAPRYVRTQAVVLLAALGIYLGPAMFFDLSYSPHDQWIFFFLAGLTMGLRPSPETAPAGQSATSGLSAAYG